MDLATIAAFTAAGLSLVNVLVSSRLTRAGLLDQWRRDTERPIVARILTLSDEARRSWQDAAFAARAPADSPSLGTASATGAGGPETSAWQKGSAAFEELRFEAANLSLVAGANVREATKELVSSHESLAHWLRPASGADDAFTRGIEESNKLSTLNDQLIAAARADIGIHSQAGRLLSRWRQA